MKAWMTAVMLATVAGCVDTNITEPGPGSGGVVFFASDREDRNFEIFRVAGDGSALRRLTDDPANDRGPVASPDGALVAWEREISGPDGGMERVEIWVMNADGSEPRAIVTNESFNDSPTWSADGESLMYASFVTGNWEIFRVALAGGEPVNLTNDPFADQYPRVSPDGGTIAFHTNRDLNFEVYAMDVDGANQRNLTQQPGDDRFPAWSPDGLTIVWSRYIDSFDLYAMDADGADQRALFESPYLDMQPAISPDGARIVFQSDRMGSPRFALFVVPIGGGEARPLTDLTNAGSDLDPFWGKNRESGQ